MLASARLQKVRGIDLKCDRKPLEHVHGRAVTTPLNGTHIRTVDAGKVGKLFLRKARLVADPPHVSSKDLSERHPLDGSPLWRI